jgi:Family of unknown function (DUF6695)
MELLKVLPAPTLPDNISCNAKWLAGEGAGSWFVIDRRESSFCISRYSPNGELECTGNYEPAKDFSLNAEFSVTYPSHCAVVHAYQNGDKIKFERLNSRI